MCIRDRSCTWHSISGTLLAGAFALKDKMAAKKAEEAAETDVYKRQEENTLINIAICDDDLVLC